MKNQTSLSRRQMLKTLGFGTMAATVSASWPQVYYSADQVKASRPTKVLRRLEPFDLTDVQLSDGPFRQARDRDAGYLLQLEPDRLLHNFRVNSGLKPKAPVYGGWESVEPWISIRCHGHTLGHYLSACSMMFAATHDTRFKQRVDYIVNDLHQCQLAGKSGLICAFPDGQTPLDQVKQATKFVGVPWYTMHKIFAGLRDAYLYAGSRRAFDVLVKLSEWAINHTKDLSDDQFQRMLNTEHGGMNEVLADVYELTGESKFLALAIRFCHRALLDPLALKQDKLDGLHSNTQIPKVIGFNRLYELTSEPNYATASIFFWRTVVNNRSFVTGGNGDGEHFFPPADFPSHVSSAKTMETCCTHNMLRLTRALFTLGPAIELADYYERALYNSILASQDPESGMMTYFQPTRPGYLKLYCTPFDSFWCCTGSGMENHAKYGDSIYFHDDESLYVNLFVPSTVSWKAKGLKLSQSTRFPDEDSTRCQLSLQRPTKLKLVFRHPSWCRELTIKLNGGLLQTSQKPGEYVAVDRIWRDHDTIEIRLPMTLRTEELPGRSDMIAFTYGPIVLAGLLGRKGLTTGADIIVNERTTGDVLKAEVQVPKLRGDAAEILGSVSRASDGLLKFQTNGIGQPDDITLVPYFRIAHERYSIYWETTHT